ncbi:hypothetical protein ACIQ9Q_33900 [Streptomyces sp. NPDC094438]|uniref:hypothetical protein n=1 Tax=Streptomyces sp. NPDC094438 TaxID=3366061 RepID=UPI0038236B4A
MTRPEGLPDKRRAHLDELLFSHPDMTALARLVRDVAQFMAERHGSDLDAWMTDVRTAQLSPAAPAWLRELPALEVPRQVWVQQ